MDITLFTLAAYGILLALALNLSVLAMNEMERME